MPRSPETQAALNCARSTIKCALELPYGFGTKDIERGILAAARAFMRSATTAEIEMMRTKNVPARLTKEECIDLYKDPTKHIMAAAAASAPRGEGRCLSSKAYDVYRSCIAKRSPLLLRLPWLMLQMRFLKVRSVETSSPGALDGLCSGSSQMPR
jgi:hypothetical protein